MIELLPVDAASNADLRALYELLRERTPEQSISHTSMPTFEQHRRWVGSTLYHGVYQAWYLLSDVPGCLHALGSIYLSDRREVGLAIFQHYQRQGYGREAVRLLRERHPGPLLANVNPANTASIKFWESLGFGLKQVTYEG